MAVDKPESPQEEGRESDAGGAPPREKPPLAVDAGASATGPAPDTAASETETETGQPENGAAPFENNRPGDPSQPRVPPARRPGLVGLVVAAVIGGVIATALGIAYHASGVIPTRAEKAAEAAAVEAASTSQLVAELQSRIAAIESRLATPSATDAKALDDRLNTLEASEKQTESRIAQLEKNTSGGDHTGADLRAAVTGLDTRLAKVEAEAMAGATEAAVSSLAARVADVEQSLKDIGTRLDAVGATAKAASESEQAARAMAIGVVRQAAQSSASFAADLSLLRGFGVEGDVLSQLQPYATAGVPTAANLRAEFPAVADAILAAVSDGESGGSIGDRLAAFGRSLVSVRPMEAIQGTTAEAIVSRMQAAVDKGDLAAALSERTALPASGQAASAAWASAAADRIALDSLIGKLAQAK